MGRRMRCAMPDTTSPPQPLNSVTVFLLLCCLRDKLSVLCLSFLSAILLDYLHTYMYLHLQLHLMAFRPAFETEISIKNRVYCPNKQCDSSYLACYKSYRHQCCRSISFHWSIPPYSLLFLLSTKLC